MGEEGSPRDGRQRWGETAPGEAVTVARSRCSMTAMLDDGDGETWTHDKGVVQAHGVAW
jgi:hypothetical protein